MSPVRVLRAFVVLASFLFFATGGCKAARELLTSAPPSSASSEAPSHDLVVSEDLSKLGRVFKFPVQPVGVRFCVQPLGMPSRAPGPTDYVDYVWIQFDERGWSALQPSTSAARGSLTLPLAVARGLLPAALVAASPKASDGVELSGPTYDTRPYLQRVVTGGTGVRVGDHLLVVTGTM